MKQPPTSPAVTVLFVVGPELRTDGITDPYTVADYVKAADQLRALGYNVISAHDVVPGERSMQLAKCHGVATTDLFTSPNAGAANLALLTLAYALNMPELPVIAWAKCAAPGAAEWFRDVFEGAL